MQNDNIDEPVATPQDAIKRILGPELRAPSSSVSYLKEPHFTIRLLKGFLLVDFTLYLV
jgi:hypothetical protein